ncbi:hypothetical protein BKA62DRAFT_786003 [Auriculariales sp. MPI-PUGE-AT-0066]|nr:hypothetical protein BKA62DRAFT_786003 [Auriculariales sp. MPI-PUGE-AT-0066]
MNNNRSEPPLHAIVCDPSWSLALGTEAVWRLVRLLVVENFVDEPDEFASIELARSIKAMSLLQYIAFSKFFSASPFIKQVVSALHDIDEDLILSDVRSLVVERDSGVGYRSEDAVESLLCLCPRICRLESSTTSLHTNIFKGRQSIIEDNLLPLQEIRLAALNPLVLSYISSARATLQFLEVWAHASVRLNNRMVASLAEILAQGAGQSLRTLDLFRDEIGLYYSGSDICWAPVIRVCTRLTRLTVPYPADYDGLAAMLQSLPRSLHVLILDAWNEDGESDSIDVAYLCLWLSACIPAPIDVPRLRRLVLVFGLAETSNSNLIRQDNFIQLESVCRCLRIRFHVHRVAHPERIA